VGPDGGDAAGPALGRGGAGRRDCTVLTAPQDSTGEADCLALFPTPRTSSLRLASDWRGCPTRTSCRPPSPPATGMSRAWCRSPSTATPPFHRRRAQPPRPAPPRPTPPPSPSPSTAPGSTPTLRDRQQDVRRDGGRVC
jgi:hypothetical protein